MSQKSKKIILTENKMLALRMICLLIKKYYGNRAQLLQADIQIPEDVSKEKILVNLLITVDARVIMDSNKEDIIKTSFICKIKKEDNKLIPVFLNHEKKMWIFSKFGQHGFKIKEQVTKN